MTRGRKPKPVALKLVEGNPGKRALPKSRPPAKKRGPGKPKGALIAPKGLTTAERATWRRLVTHAPHGVLTRADEELLTQYVRTRRVYDEANGKLKLSGSLLTVTKAGDVKANPLIKIVNDQSDRMTRILSELGFSPTARSRLGVLDDAPVEAQDDAESRYFG